MAGRVERRINNKFYFVLDEVGDSSDGEAELAPNNPIKVGDDLSENSTTSFRNDMEDSSASKNYTTEDLINVTNSVQTMDSGGNQEDISEDNSIPDKTEIKRHDTNEISPMSDPTAVDMDIDNEIDSGEPNIEPLLRITFRDESVEELLKPSLHKCISTKFKNCKIITSDNGLKVEVYERDPRKICEDDLIDFNLDTTPSDNHVDVPYYGKDHDLVLSDEKPEEKSSRKVQGFNISCFNCLGCHTLKDCPETKNFVAIRSNRLMFQNKLQKVSRYHLDENQKFSHIAPGVISKKLRHALNLHRDQQPEFIYRMRLLGYPPAWLEEAKVSHSGVAMYDKIGVRVLEEDEEEGEIVPEGAKDKFDISKIIEFPGFNVPLPNNFKDESKLYRCPGLSEDQSKENLIKLLEPKTVQAYVKKSMNPKSEKTPSKNEMKRASSPTIEEMEEKKRQLLMELNDEDSASVQMPTETLRSRELGSVKKLELGTPILKSVSPFSKLPSREQFSVNVSDVINFENLPNSTGKYETMREVISKIRTSTSKSSTE